VIRRDSRKIWPLRRALARTRPRGQRDRRLCVGRVGLEPTTCRIMNLTTSLATAWSASGGREPGRDDDSDRLCSEQPDQRFAALGFSGSTATVARNSQTAPELPHPRFRRALMAGDAASLAPTADLRLRRGPTPRASRHGGRISVDPVAAHPVVARGTVELLMHRASIQGVTGPPRWRRHGRTCSRRIWWTTNSPGPAVVHIEAHSGDRHLASLSSVLEYPRCGTWSHSWSELVPLAAPWSLSRPSAAPKKCMSPAMRGQRERFLSRVSQVRILPGH
jgi:hypothetical protein